LVRKQSYLHNLLYIAGNSDLRTVALYKNTFRKRCPRYGSTKGTGITGTGKNDSKKMPKRKEIIELKNQRLQYDLRHKSQELASSTMNLIRKNEILLDISQNLNKVAGEINEKSDNKAILRQISKMQDEIKKTLSMTTTGNVLPKTLI
jgi:hypothetical protein